MDQRLRQVDTASADAEARGIDLRELANRRALLFARDVGELGDFNRILPEGFFGLLFQEIPRVKPPRPFRRTLPRFGGWHLYPEPFRGWTSRRVGRLDEWHGTAYIPPAVLRAIKNLRSDFVDRWFRRCSAATGRKLAAELSARGCRNAAFTVAFNAPWVVDLLTAAWARYQPGVPLVVIDNSSVGSARQSHRDLCRRRGVPYLPLPWNPEWSPNRSHGISLNWIWFNVVRHAAFDLVGFIDHDCIPIADFDLRERLREYDAYGLWGASLKHPEAWNIWAGYCFLRPAAATAMRVDFKHRIEYGLDTGGGNWSGFYRRLPSSRVGTAATRTLRIEPGAGRTAADLLLLDESFLHLDGASYKAAHRDIATRGRLIDMLATGRIAERLEPSPSEQ